MKRYSKYIKPYIAAFIMGPIMMITEVIGEVLLPRFMATIINTGVANRDISAVWGTGLLMLLSCLLMVVGGTLGCYFSAKASISFSADLRRDLFSKVQEFSFTNIDDFSTGSLVTRLTNDVQQIQNMIAMMLRMALRAPGMLIGGIIMAMSLNAKLGMIIVVIIPVMTVIIFFVTKLSFPRFEAMQTALDNLNNRIRESLTNVRVIKSFVREDYENKRFNEKNGELREKTLNALNILITIGPIMMFFMHLATVCVVWFGGNLVIKTNMPVGDLTAFITYVTQILSSLMMVAMVILQSTRSVASFKRTSAVLDTVVDITDDKAAFPQKKVESGDIVFENVSFDYPGDEDSDDDTGCVLFDVNLHIKSGETVGILGATGCGKTSLVQLIPRLYDTTNGRVLVDGVDVKDYSLKNLRDGVAMVLQYNTLFSGSVAENLRWGDDEADDDTVREFASYAQADGFVSAMGQGYDTMITRGGSNVSGGQKQRLCIARALLKKPKILILDDSTSAVDTATEARIREAFATTLKDTTKLIIAQRIGSVRDADRIIVMDDGKVVDIGTHDQLLARCTEYEEIYYSQIDREEAKA